MSGEWDDNWTHSSVEQYAERLIEKSPNNPLHVAFANHLKLVATALHDLTWVFSGDIGPGDEEEAIRAVITPALELDAALETAKAAVAQLQGAIDRASSPPEPSP